MEWKLDDNRPIWMQLQEQLTRKILSGWYRAGEKLPSVRELAAEAGVNPYAKSFGRFRQRRADRNEPDDRKECNGG